MANIHSHGHLWSTPTPARHDRTHSDGQTTLEITVLWGATVLAVRHLSPPRPFRVGEAVSADFILGAETDAHAAKTLVDVAAGEVRVFFENGASARLELGDKVTVAWAGLTFALALAPRETARFPAALDLGWLGYVGAAALSAAGFVLALAAFVPPLGLADSEELDRERLAVLLQYLDTEAERERLAEPTSDAGSGAASSPSAEAKGEAGELGKPNAPRRNARYASNAAPDARALTRSEAIHEASTFGLLGLLAAAAPMNPGALWDRDSALEKLDLVAFGNLFGQDIDDAAGSNGLGLSGPGQGSGGLGVGIGLGVGGPCASVGGCLGGGGDERFGRSHHLGTRGHKGVPPRITPNPPTMSGSLPAEVVQRVVRQNHGRFRHCYEDGLRKNPTLSGRVTARFVIDRSGAVSLAQNGGSDLPDSAVVACVVQTFYSLSFPAPAQGTVRVSYPIVFNVG